MPEISPVPQPETDFPDPTGSEAYQRIIDYLQTFVVSDATAVTGPAELTDGMKGLAGTLHELIQLEGAPGGAQSIPPPVEMRTYRHVAEAPPLFPDTARVHLEVATSGPGARLAAATVVD